MRALFIETRVKTDSFLIHALNEELFNVDLVENGMDGLAFAMNNDYDIILLGTTLPDIDGWEVLRRLRDRGKDTPVLLLTSLNDVEGRVRGFELGADDCLDSPFDFSEFLARITAILRRGPALATNTIQIADLEINFLARRVTREGKRIDLTQKEFALFSRLVRRSGEVLSRARLAARIWPVDSIAVSNVVDVHMRRLRLKIDDPFPVKLIHTVRGAGYVLEARA